MNKDKKNRILNYSIFISVVILLVLVTMTITTGSLGNIMGNSVYSNEKQIGDIVNYHDSNWYVIGNNNRSYTLLKESALTGQEMGLSSDLVPYDFNDNCMEGNDDNCHSNLNDSYIGSILNYYQKNYLAIQELVTIDDYTIRLLNNNDYQLLKNYSFLYLNNFYWTMIEPNYSGYNVYGLYPNKALSIQMVYDNGGLVRPVINVSKSVIK